MDEVAAMMLFCAGTPTAAANAGPDMVGVVRIPVDAEMVSSLDGEPPLSSMSFVGEAEPPREWIIVSAKNTGAEPFTLVRITKTGDRLHPYAFKAGLATKRSDATYTFESQVGGTCDLRARATPAEGSKQ